MYPNPVRRGEFVHIGIDYEGDVLCVLSDVNGAAIVHEHVLVNENEYIRLTIPKGIDSGIYTLRLVYQEGVSTSKIVVL